MLVIDSIRRLCPWMFPRKPIVDHDKLIQIIRTAIHYKGVLNYRSDAVFQVLMMFKPSLPFEWTEAAAREIADAIDTMRLPE